MENFHLTREELLQPLILGYNIMDELDSQLSVDLDGSFPFFLTIEPCFCPPNDAVLVGIYAYRSLYVETLNVNIQILKRVYKALAVYCVVSSFFFSCSLKDERKTPWNRAR